MFYFCGREGGICERTQIDFCEFIEDLRKAGLTKGQCLSRLLPRFKRLLVAPGGSRWLPVAAAHTNTRCCWLLMAPNGSHHVSLLPNHTPKCCLEWLERTLSASGGADEALQARGGRSRDAN